jgi:HSP20 family molecular chaperone IbpA
MAKIEKSIEVGAPLRAVYNQWTRFEDFPRFIEGVLEVRRLDEARLRWHAQIGGKDKHWDARITEQVPDQRIAWQSVSGSENSGTVELEPIAAQRTRVTLKASYDPEGVLENFGDALGVTARRIEADLGRFKRFVEGRGAEGAAGRERGGVRGLLGGWEDPVAAIRRMSDQMDRLFDGLVGGRLRGAARAQPDEPGTWMPQVAISQRGEQYVVSADLPGVRREDVRIDIDDGLIVIRGERRRELERAQAGVLRSECSYGSFYRAVPLPEGADAGAARAAMRDGVLEIALPMPPRRQPRRLDIEDQDVAARNDAYRHPTEPANEQHPHSAEQDRRQGERRDWQSEGRLGM